MSGRVSDFVPQSVNETGAIAILHQMCHLPDALSLTLL